MSTRTIGLICLGLLAVVTWAVAQPGADKQPPDKQPPDRQPGGARYQFYTTQTNVIMYDPQTGKTWALATAPFSREEFAWVPIRKFDDEAAYQRWLQEQRDKMFKDKGFPF